MEELLEVMSELRGSALEKEAAKSEAIPELKEAARAAERQALELQLQVPTVASNCHCHCHCHLTYPHVCSRVEVVTVASKVLAPPSPRARARSSRRRSDSN